MRGPLPVRGRGAAGAGRPLRWIVPSLLVITSVAGLAVACSPEDASVPAPSVSPSQSTAGSPGPKPTAWPTLTIEAAIALGAADNDFGTMAADVVAAVEAEDPARILVAMEDALTFLEGNQSNVPRLQEYGATKDVGDRLAPAYAQMIAGAHRVGDGLNGANAADVEAGFLEFFAGNEAYVVASTGLGALAEQALFMKRLLMR